jgi:hypothetical protein
MRPMSVENGLHKSNSLASSSLNSVANSQGSMAKSEFKTNFNSHSQHVIDMSKKANNTDKAKVCINEFFSTWRNMIQNISFLKTDQNQNEDFGLFVTKLDNGADSGAQKHGMQNGSYNHSNSNGQSSPTGKNRKKVSSSICNRTIFQYSFFNSVFFFLCKAWSNNRL